MSSTESNSGMTRSTNRPESFTVPISADASSDSSLESFDSSAVKLSQRNTRKRIPSSLDSGSDEESPKKAKIVTSNEASDNCETKESDSRGNDNESMVGGGVKKKTDIGKQQPGYRRSSTSSLETEDGDGPSDGGNKPKRDSLEVSEKDTEIDGVSNDSDTEIKQKKKGSQKSCRKKKNEKNASGDGNSDVLDENDDRKGRKRIRKILKTKALSSETKTAEAVEKERRKRLEERQRFYNTFVNEEEVEDSGLSVTRMILDCKDGTTEPLIEVDKDFVKHLKSHQVQAVRFLWDSLIESVKEHTDNADRISGAILAHCMGLGKTLSTISFVHALMTNGNLLKIKTCLIICPVNTLLNWHREWRQWMPEGNEVDVFEVATSNASKFRIDVIRRWHTNGGVLLLGYDMYRNLTTSLLKRSRKPTLKELIRKSLMDPGPDIVVCDEGHLLKNYKAGITKAVCAIKTKKRIILTGTPLQNNLTEYWTMVNFVKPNLLGSAKEFANRFANPIRNGQHLNSTALDVQIMKKRAHVLFKTLDGCVQRKDYSCLTKYLPPRFEYVLKIRLCEVQRKLYDAFLVYRGSRVELGLQEVRSTLFKDQQTLYRIWTHPHTLRMHETKEAKRLLLEGTTTEEEESLSDSSEQEMDEATLSSGSEAGDGIRSSSSEQITVTRSGRRTRRQSMFGIDNTRPKRSTRKPSSTINLLLLSDEDDAADADVGSDASLQMSPTIRRASDAPKHENVDTALEENGRQPWWYSMYLDEFDHRIDVGSKLEVLFQLIRKCMDIGDKMLIFSQSLFSLDLIEWFLAVIDRQWCRSQGLEVDSDTKIGARFTSLEKEAATIAHSGLEVPSLSEYFSDIGFNTWRKGKDYERIDGSINATLRNSLQNRFNGPSKRFRLLIISTKAGGLGVNLTAGNRLVIFDVSWNPSHDIQSIFRSYRFGQTKPVYIYRLVAQGTMEEKMYDRQVTKQSLALRVVDEQQVDRHFTEDDLRELYTFEPDIWDPKEAGSRPPPVLPKDRLLADMLSDFPHLISSYHTHDSLLENRVDEGLTDSERQEAWREYEEEKRVGRSYADYQRLLAANQEAMAAKLMSTTPMGVYNQPGFPVSYPRWPKPVLVNPASASTDNLNSTIDSYFTPVHTNVLTGLRPGFGVNGAMNNNAGGIAGNYALDVNHSGRRPPAPDHFSQLFSSIRSSLLAQYPMLARSPSALHEMTMRLFLTTMTGAPNLPAMSMGSTSSGPSPPSPTGAATNPPSPPPSASF